MPRRMGLIRSRSWKRSGRTGRNRKRAYLNRRRPRSTVKGNRVRSSHAQFKRRRMFKSRRSFGGRTSQTITYTNTNTVKAYPTTYAGGTWAELTEPQAMINATLPPAANQPYKFLFKQFRVKKILTYVRFVNTPEVTVTGQNAANDLTDPDAAIMEQGQMYTPIHWELFYRANNQADPPVTDELKYDFNKVGVTNNGKQYKFSVKPMVNYLLQTLDPNTKLPVASNVKYYRPSGWVDMDDPATQYVYKVADVLNHSYYNANTFIGATNPRSLGAVNGYLETSFTFVLEYRWRKNKSILDATGGNNPVPADTVALSSVPGGLELITSPPGTGA